MVLVRESTSGRPVSRAAELKKAAEGVRKELDALKG
jgi:hypothetical protein